MNDENFQKSRKTNLKILNKNIVEQIYGPIAAPYLADKIDKVFGIYQDKDINNLKIGSTEVEVWYNDKSILNPPILCGHAFSYEFHNPIIQTG